MMVQSSLERNTVERLEMFAIFVLVDAHHGDPHSTVQDQLFQMSCSRIQNFQPSRFEELIYAIYALYRDRY